MKAFPLLFVALLISCLSMAWGQDLIKNPSFEYDGTTLKAWRIGLYLGGKANTDWRETGVLKVESQDSALVIEAMEPQSATMLYQSAANFVGGGRYRVTLTYDDSGFDGKVLVMFDGGASGVRGVAPLEFPHTDKSGEFVTTSLEVELPADATVEMMGTTVIQIRLMGQGKVRLQSIAVDPL